MKIYLDDGFASEHGGGIGVYSKILVTGLRQTQFEVKQAHYPLLKKIKPPALRKLLYSFYLNFMLPGYLKKHGFTIAHFTNSQIPARKNGFTKYVATVHDLNPVLHPETVPGLYAKYYARALRNVVRNSDSIITVSESVRAELLQRYKIPAHRVMVCYNAMQAGVADSMAKVERGEKSEERVLQDFSLAAGNYFLFVGRLERRKNIVVLIDAFSEFKKSTNSNFKLVLVGARGFGFEEIERAREKSAFQEDIIITGYVTSAALRSLYAAASAFILPSLDEGFGIPLVEAMQFNLPLILSDINTNREIVNSKALYFNKHSSRSLAEVLIDFCRNKPKGFNYAEILKKYTAENMIKSHVGVYAELIN